MSEPINKVIESQKCILKIPLEIIRLLVVEDSLKRHIKRQANARWIWKRMEGESPFIMCTAGDNLK